MPSESLPTSTPKKRKHVLSFIVLALLIACFVGVWRLVRNVREATHLSQCKQNVFFLGFALWLYHEAEGSFPPLMLPTRTGSRFIAGEFSLPLTATKRNSLIGTIARLHGTKRKISNWPRMRTSTIFLLAQATRTTKDARDEDFDPSRPRMTNYVAIVGSGTAFPGGDKSVSLEDITDGPENTILLVEIANSDIHWSEPRDLVFDEMSFKINDPAEPSISSPHADGPNVVFVDGRSHRLSESIPPDILRGLITINGGEKISRYDLKQQGFLR